MTEDEAKTKWCPHVRHATVVYGIRRASMARYGTGERVSLAEVRAAYAASRQVQQVAA